jgi:indolepyruvate ferredoxin oxidoreductase
LRRLLEIRVPDLIAYQDEAYAERYAGFVALVAQAERRATPGRTALAEAVARYLYKLMAYKDEYEVARLHLDAAPEEIAARAGLAGQEVRVTWQLHPPLLREWGLEQKIGLGPWFRPGLRALRAMKGLRATPLDPFGRTEVRRTERALIAEYRRMVKDACARLTPETHVAAVALAELPDMVRGYEQVKLDNVRRYREAAQNLLAQLGAPAPAVDHGPV